MAINLWSCGLLLSQHSRQGRPNGRARGNRIPPGPREAPPAPRTIPAHPSELMSVLSCGSSRPGCGAYRYLLPPPVRREGVRAIVLH